MDALDLTPRRKILNISIYCDTSRRTVMNPNAAPLDVLHKSRLTSIALGACALLFAGAGISVSFSVGLMTICLVFAGALVLYGLFFDIQTVEFFPTHILINSILRKRRFERADIEFVSMETGTTRAGGISRTYHYVQMRLRSGRKINFGSFNEGIDAVYQKLKACESTNEEFLIGR
jgi:hypothetical protein